MNQINDVFKILEPYLKDHRQEVIGYMEYILNFPQLNLSDMHLGYFEDNIILSQLIPKDLIVVDVGCGFGFQHVLFENHKGYIGIQKFFPSNIGEKEPEVKMFTGNSKFINGFFRDVYKELNITDENRNQYFGISNHSLLNNTESKEDLKIFNEIFIKKYINGRGI